tara:strand:+ start:212 stop:487 length:276 start_codon:yes stop_codon:yes gene_type:complete
MSASDFLINSEKIESWSNQANRLPDNVTIAGKVYKSEELDEECRKLISIYQTDAVLIGQFRELVALAELGLKRIEQEVQLKVSPPKKKSQS